MVPQWFLWGPSHLSQIPYSSAEVSHGLNPCRLFVKQAVFQASVDQSHARCRVCGFTLWLFSSMFPPPTSLGSQVLPVTHRTACFPRKTGAAPDRTLAQVPAVAFPGSRMNYLFLFHTNRYWYIQYTSITARQFMYMLWHIVQTWLVLPTVIRKNKGGLPQASSSPVVVNHYSQLFITVFFCVRP